MECHPEENYDGEHENETDDSLASLGRRHLVYYLIYHFFFLFHGEHLTEGLLAKIIYQDAGNHRNACHGKCEVIGVGLRVAQRELCPVHYLDGCGRCEECAHVDEHVEKREA